MDVGTLSLVEADGFNLSASPRVLEEPHVGLYLKVANATNGLNSKVASNATEISHDPKNGPESSTYLNPIIYTLLAIVPAIVLGGLGSADEGAAALSRSGSSGWWALGAAICVIAALAGWDRMLLECMCFLVRCV